MSLLILGMVTIVSVILAWLVELPGGVLTLVGLPNWLLIIGGLLLLAWCLDD